MGCAVEFTPARLSFSFIFSTFCAAYLLRLFQEPVTFAEHLLISFMYSPLTYTIIYY